MKKENKGKMEVLLHGGYENVSLNVWVDREDSGSTAEDARGET